MSSSATNSAAHLGRQAGRAAAAAPRMQPTLDRSAVVTAAGDLVDEVGPEALTLTRVAERLGVTQPALYRHVASLADLWRLLGIDTRSRLAEALAEASIGRARGDAVASLATAWRRFAIDHPGRYASAGRHAIEGEPELVAAANRTIAVLERALGGYGLADAERRFAADTLRSAFHGFASYEIGHGHPDPDRLDASFERLVHHLTVAFTAEAAGGVEAGGIDPDGAAEPGGGAT
ncbi:MAG: WHG domain-containing protein [Actinomycetota bacterium]